MAIRLAKGGGLALGVLIATSALVRADVTPEQVWQNWQQLTARSGRAVEAGASAREGDVLRLTDVHLSAQTAEGSAEGSIPWVEMRQAGGEVAITLADSYDLSISTQTTQTDDAGDTRAVPSVIGVRINHPGLKITASGVPSDISYAYDAPTVGFSLIEVTVDDEPVTDVTLEGSFDQLSGKARVQDNGAMIATDLASGAATLAFAGKDPNTGEAMNATLAVADLAGRSESTLPSGISAQSTSSEALAAGMSSRNTFSYGPARLLLEVEGEDSATVRAEAAGGEAEVALSATGLHYAASTREGSLAVSTPNLPAEMRLGYARSGFDFTGPVLASDTASDFSLKMELADLIAGDELWALFDPDQVLDRAPGQLLADLTGKGRWTTDLLATGTPEVEELPAQVEAVDIHDFRLALAGADLTATGAFTFDNSDLEARGGMPQAVGKADLTLKGGQTLIDNLVTLGVLPSDQAMFAKMMLMGLAKQGDGPDTLVSRIELTQDGRILANGMGLQ